MAVANGIPFNVETMRSMLKSLAQKLFPGHRWSLTLNVTDVGEFGTPWEEPADRVEYFAGYDRRGWFRNDRQSAQQMLEWFCQRRVCRRDSRAPYTSIGEVGNVTVRPFEEPAYVLSARGRGRWTTDERRDYVSSFRMVLCPTIVPSTDHGPAPLVVNGVGNITVALPDPAAVVEHSAPKRGDGLRHRCRAYSRCCRTSVSEILPSAIDRFMALNWMWPTWP